MPVSLSTSTRRIASAWVTLALCALAPSVLRAQNPSYTLLGDVQDAEPVPTGVLIRAQHGAVLIESVAHIGTRVRVRFGEPTASSFVAPHSLGIGDAPVALSALTMHNAGDTIVIVGAEGIDVRVARHPLRVILRDAAGHELLRDTYGALETDHRFAHYVRHVQGTRYFGLGEQATPMIRNGTVFPFWNTDRFNYRPLDTPIYSSMPFYIAVTDGVAHGVLYDNSFRGEMDFAGRLPGSIEYSADGAPDGGELRYYVVAGPTLADVMSRFSMLTGRMPLPPRWALGYQQSRYSYAPDTMVMNVAREMRKRDIPADALYLDIGYMDGYRVFTWNPTGFSHPKAMLDSLGAMGFKVVAIVDPGVKVDTAFRVYQQGLALHAFLTTPDGAPALGTVWPGVAAYPDFSRESVRGWWGNAQSALVDPGVRGIWNDMNEPASFTGLTLSDLVQFDGDGHPGSHLQYHNQYGTLMARASFDGLRKLRPELRPFVVTRAAYTGVQRYSSVWTGDNSSTWDHLRLSLSMVLSLGLSGEPFAGSDIGGFTGTPTAELYGRWLQSAALLPFFRTHSSIDVPRREPWTFGAGYERANRSTIRLRYRLMPAIYSAFRQHTQNGSPVVRPIFWGELADTLALNVGDEYFLGDHLLAAPVVDSSADQRSVYLPKGRWFRLGTDSAYDGTKRVTVSAPEALRDKGDTTGLRGLPLFARAGAVIPMQAVLSYEHARKIDTLELHVWGGSLSPVTSTVYEDDGDGYGYERGAFRSTTITTSTIRAGALDLALARQGSYAGAQSLLITLHGISRPRTVRADGKTVRPRYDAESRTTTFVLSSGVQHIVITP